MADWTMQDGELAVLRQLVEFHLDCDLDVEGSIDEVPYDWFALLALAQRLGKDPASALPGVALVAEYPHDSQVVSRDVRSLGEARESVKALAGPIGAYLLYEGERRMLLDFGLDRWVLAE